VSSISNRSLNEIEIGKTYEALVRQCPLHRHFFVDGNSPSGVFRRRYGVDSSSDEAIRARRSETEKREQGLKDIRRE
jgi:hypothetical protein